MLKKIFKNNEKLKLNYYCFILTFARALILASMFDKYFAQFQRTLNIYERINKRVALMFNKHFARFKRTLNIYKRINKRVQFH